MADKTPTTPRLSLTLRIVFALSLALNLAVVGALAGAWWRGGHPEGPGAGGQVAALYRALPDEARRSLRAEMRGAMNRDGQQAMRIRGRLMAALKAEPFDAAAVEAILVAQADALGAVQQRMRAAWLARVAAMTPDERRAYAERVEAEFAQRRR